jgi:hypothetical protein
MTMKTNDNGIDRDMTEAEKAVYSATAKDILDTQKVLDKTKTDKATARQAVLDRLGITADEAALLLG